VETLSALPQGEIIKVIDEFREIISFVQEEDRPAIVKRDAEIETELWCFITRFAAINDPVLRVNNIIPALMDFYKVERIPSLVFPKRLLHPRRITAKYLASIKERQGTHPDLNKQLDLPLDPSGNLSDLRIPPGNLDNLKRGDEIKMLNRLSDSEGQLTGENELMKVPEEEGIFVRHAGLVLLHPFLDRFFNNLGLVKNGSFTDMYSHQKSLYLLHYLSTGELKGPEHELVTAKVICAYPLHKPVEKYIELTGDEINEANELLVNVIGQWDVLKNSSPEGLREGFLQRNGKYTAKNEKGCLYVESHAIDILLDHLPWNIHIVKLPWMIDPLWVEWR
jgi:hypothetical protein